MYKDKETNILGVHINNWGRLVLHKKIEKALFSNKGGTFLVTPNPEIILEANQDDEYKKILNSADISIADGSGLFFANLILQYRFLERIPGVDITRLLLEKAQEHQLRVLWVRHERSLTQDEDAYTFVKNKYPNCIIKVHTWDESKENLQQCVEAFRPTIVFSSLGAPRQERLAYYLYEKYPFIKLSMGNGGAFDFLCGKIKRAPSIMQKIGIEWLWRFMLEPRYRFNRIRKAVISFPLRVCLWKIRSLCLYRKNVIGCIVNQKEQLMMIHLQHYQQWGFPQGGQGPAETLEHTAIREMGEELGISKDKLKVIGKKDSIYVYKWKLKHRLMRGYKGQKQSVVYLKFLGNDGDVVVDHIEIDKWKWVNSSEVLQKASAVRRNSAKLVVKYLPKVY